eukprot:c22787_g1_i1 orf=1081-1602(-)
MAGMAVRPSLGARVTHESSVVPSSVVTEKSRTTTEACRATATSPVVEVQQVHCECCGLGEECTPAYIDHVRGLYCGRWVCGLCAEAVKEERGKATRMERLDEGLEDALQAHMSFCMEFNNSEKTSPVLHLAAAMRRLFRRSLDGNSGSRSAPNSPRLSALSRSSMPSQCRTPL